MKHLAGSPYDRGMADSYYQRQRNPHYRTLTPGTKICWVEHYDLTPEQILEYNEGYDFNESILNFKDYGDR